MSYTPSADLHELLVNITRDGGNNIELSSIAKADGDTLADSGSDGTGGFTDVVGFAGVVTNLSLVSAAIFAQIAPVCAADPNLDQGNAFNFGDTAANWITPPPDAVPTPDPWGDDSLLIIVPGALTDDDVTAYGETLWQTIKAAAAAGPASTGSLRDSALTTGDFGQAGRAPLSVTQAGLRRLRSR